MWVRLLPLVVNVERIRDKYVDGDGVFVFEDLSPGPYLIVYMKEGTPLRVNNVQVYLGDGVTLPPMAWSGSGGSR